jgi:hypothetical protein
MDYSATVSAKPVGGEVCERVMSTAEIAKDIRRELSETLCCLSDIKLSIDGEEPRDRAADEPKCLNDEIRLINRMALDCMGMAHVIRDILFKNTEGM